MKTSPTTSSSESRVRTALLDVLHAHWRALGVPFTSPLPTDTLEVVDPEALVWGSLEFLDDEPRLAEGVTAWLTANRSRLITQRLSRFASTSPKDRRDRIWHDLSRYPNAAFAGERRGERRGGRRRTAPSTDAPVGRESRHAASLYLRARDVLGRDCRSFLVVTLLAAERGVRLREVAQWTGYTYRTIAEAIGGWERQGVVRVQHGHCVLVKPALWRQLLECEHADVITVDWSAALIASVELLRTLAKARKHGFGDDHDLVVSAVETTRTALHTAGAGYLPERTPALTRLRDALGP